MGAGDGAGARLAWLDAGIGGQAGGNAHGQNGSGTASGSQPYSGYRDPGAGNGAAPPPDTAGAAPPPDDGPQMTAAAQYTYAQYIASGWTDAQLRTKGLMV